MVIFFMASDNDEVKITGKWEAKWKSNWEEDWKKYQKEEWDKSYRNTISQKYSFPLQPRNQDIHEFA